MNKYILFFTTFILATILFQSTADAQVGTSIAASQMVTIDAHSACRKVTNPGSGTRKVFTGTAAEWQSFYTNPSGLTIAACTYAWNSGAFGTCSANPTWSAYGGWGACSASCGGGTQTRTRTCSGTSGSETRSVTCRRHDAVTVADSFCGGGKPATSQSCTENCSGSATASQSCNTQSCAPVEMYYNPQGSVHNGAIYYSSCDPGKYFFGCAWSSSENPYDEAWYGFICYNGTAVNFACNRFSGGTTPSSVTSGGYTYTRGTEYINDRYGGRAHGVTRTP